MAVLATTQTAVLVQAVVAAPEARAVVAVLAGVEALVAAMHWGPPPREVVAQAAVMVPPVPCLPRQEMPQ
jgi:hypothetical protein